MTIEINQLTASFSTCPQITEADIPDIVAQGFKTIINNRPDLEGGESQPMSASLQAAAEKHGLRYIHIPVIPNKITESDVKACATALENNETPVLAFCRTGNRAANLFQLVNK